jgi:hypothetical protein
MVEWLSYFVVTITPGGLGGRKPMTIKVSYDHITRWQQSNGNLSYLRQYNQMPAITAQTTAALEVTPGAIS